MVVSFVLSCWDLKCEARDLRNDVSPHAWLHYDL
jgi:hypothetical protein